MSDDLHRQIYGNMNFKDTEELLEIWKKNNREVWTATAFDVVREILEERIGELPPQGEPIFTYPEEKESEMDGDDEEDDALDLEEWEEKLIDSNDQPTFYDTLEVIDLRRRLDQVAKLAIIVNIVYGIFLFSTTQSIVSGSFPSDGDALIRIAISFVGLALGVGLNIIMMYFPLKALAYILRVLMEMEFNSRK